MTNRPHDPDDSPASDDDQPFGPENDYTWLPGAPAESGQAPLFLPSDFMRQAADDPAAADAPPADHADDPARHWRRPHRLFEEDATTRELVLAWCLWLLGSWAVTLAIDSPRPAVQPMTFAAVIGLMVLWPAVRLSQGWGHFRGRFRGHGPESGANSDHLEVNTVHADANAVHEQANMVRADARQTLGLIFRDWLCLNLVLQAVIWPLRLTAHWSIAQTAWLVAALATWSLLTGLIIAWGAGSRDGVRRTLAMALCLLVLLAEPAAMAALNLVGGGGAGAGLTWAMRVSPLEALLAISATRDAGSWELGPWGVTIACVGAAAALGWTALAAGRGRG